MKRLIDLGWGWNDSTYIGAYQRLNESVQCYGEIAVDHSDVIAGILSPPFVKDEVRITNLYRVSHTIFTEILFKKRFIKRSMNFFSAFLNFL